MRKIAQFRVNKTDAACRHLWPMEINTNFD